MHVAVRAHSGQGITHEAQKEKQRQTSSKVLFAPPKVSRKNLGKNKKSTPVKQCVHPLVPLEMSTTTRLVHKWRYKKIRCHNHAFVLCYVML